MLKQQESDLFPKQIELLKDILSVKEQTLWKVLIFDSFNQQTLSTLFKVKDLREYNITLYMNIAQKRQQLYGVTAYYLIQPTSQNLQLISRDFDDELYSAISIHFSSQPSKNMLSTLAKQISSKYPKQLSKIKKITHSFIGYHVIDRTMGLMPTEIELANFLAQFRYPPVLFFQKNQQVFANSVKDRLDALRAPNLFSDGSGYTGVLIVNRESDYSPVLFHQITYGGLMTDIYQMLGYNKVRIGSQTHDFNIQDEVWLDKKHMHISDFDLERQISKVKARQNSLKDNLQEFAELAEKNKKLDWHLARANELITKAKQRQLNSYSSVQSDIISTKKLSKQNKKTALQLLSQKGNNNDKLRLIMLYLICSDDVGSLQQLQKAIEDVRKPAIYNQLKDRKLKEISQREGGNAKFIKNLAKGIWKNLIAGEAKFLVTRFAQQLLKSALVENGFQSLQLRASQNRLKKAIVYVRGGACLNEYQNLRTFAPDVIYTGDRLTDARQIME